MKKYHLNIAKISHLDSIGLWDEPHDRSLIELIRQLNYIQIDTIYTIARSQDIVAHSRSQSYKEKDVWKSIKKGEIFEGWAHAKCLLPKEHFPYYYSASIDRRKQKTWWQKELNKISDWPMKVLKQIENSGAVKVGDIEIPKSFPKSSGWNSPAKRILDYLERRGYIMAIRSDDFRISYDITERVMKIPDTFIPYEKRFWFYIKTTLDAIGLAPLHRLLHYKYNHKQFIADNKKINPRSLISSAIKNGELSEIVIENKKFIANTNVIDKIDNLEVKEKNELQAFLLSPFDNSLWSRESLLTQYHYDFKMEIYIPKNKRKYGYFVLPILYGTDFVGRVEVKFYREIKSMVFSHWYWEKNFSIDNIFIEALTSTIKRFSDFHQADTINLGDLKNKRKFEDFL